MARGTTLVAMHAHRRLRLHAIEHMLQSIARSCPDHGEQTGKNWLESIGKGLFNAAFILLPSSLLFATPGPVLRARHRRSHTNHRLAV